MLPLEERESVECVFLCFMTILYHCEDDATAGESEFCPRTGSFPEPGESWLWWVTHLVLCWSVWSCVWCSHMSLIDHSLRTCVDLQCRFIELYTTFLDDEELDWKEKGVLRNFFYFVYTFLYTHPCVICVYHIPHTHTHTHTHSCSGWTSTCRIPGRKLWPIRAALHGTLAERAR